MRSVLLVMVVDVEVAGPGRIEPRGGLLDLKAFLRIRFISLMIKVFERERTRLHKCQNVSTTIRHDSNCTRHLLYDTE
jgi:hypothetical protein